MAAGCPLVDRSGTSYSGGRRSSSYSSATGREAKGPVDNFLTISAKKSASNAFGFNRFSRDLWGPFACEVTLGSMDEDHPVVFPSIMCMEIDVKGSDPLRFFLLCAQPQVNGSMLVYAGSHNGTGDSLVFDNTSEVDLRVTYDGNLFSFWARPRDSGGYDMVDTIFWTQDDRPFTPSIGASSLTGGAVACFDLMRVTENGEEPEATGREHADDRLREAMWEVGDDALEAWYEVDRDFPNMEDVDGYLEDALDGIAGLQEEEDLSSSKQRKKAGKALKKAAKKFAGARKKIDQGKPASKVWKDIGKGLKSLLWKITALDDEPF
jgi:hypothetical protein